MGERDLFRVFGVFRSGYRTAQKFDGLPEFIHDVDEAAIFNSDPSHGQMGEGSQKQIAIDPIVHIGPEYTLSLAFI